MNAEAENPSMRDERSEAPYNDEKVTSPDMLKRLKREHGDFKGDWSHLERLVRNLDADKARVGLEPEERLGDWNVWEQEACTERGERIHLEGAHLWQAQLEGARLVEAHLEGAYLRQAHLEGAYLREAVFDQADLRRARDLCFNDNSVFRIRIEGNARDPWSVLRRKYTGPWFFVHLLLLIAFFTPYLAKFTYVSALSRAQDYVVERAQALESQAGQSEQRLLQIAAEHEQQIPWLGDVVGAAAEQRQQFMRQLEEDLKRRYTQTRAVWVLVGWTDAWWAFALALVVLGYNVCRGVLTLRVSALRDAEERSQVTPKLGEYWPLYRVHRLAKWLLVVAVSATLFNVGLWVWTTKVYTPTGIVAPTAASQPTERAEHGAAGASDQGNIPAPGEVWERGW